MDSEEDVQRFIIAFGKQVKTLREEKGLTQLDLAIRAEMDVRQIQRIEHGQINTSIGNVFLIARALGVTTSDVVYRID